MGEDPEKEQVFVVAYSMTEKERNGIMKTYRTNILRLMSMVLAFALIISFVNVQNVEAKTKKKNIAVLYFSATGTTRGAAKKIGKATKGNVIEIKAKNPYTDKDLDYSDENSRVSREHVSAKTPVKSKVRPKIANIKAIKKVVKKADVVYIGYPIWWGEAPHIVYSLVENVSLKKKTVIPFSTSISSGLGSSGKHLKTRAQISSKTKWMKGRNFYDVPSQKMVNKWVKSLEY